MQSFKNCYLQRCSELSIEPLPILANIFKEIELTGPDSNSPRTLNLSSISLSLKACDALGFALKENSIFQKLILADSFLGDDGCIKIVNSLKSNTTLELLDMRGNGIRSDGAIAIGQMLKINNSIKELLLEWNCIGIWDSGLKSISEALSMNQTLEFLDLRNNKIGPHAIQNLAICLKQNTSLKKLDLRWNHAGLVGGRQLVELLKWNNTLLDVNVAGNEIPDDTLKAISAALDRNRDRWHHDIHSKAHAETLANTISSLSHTHTVEILSLQEKLSLESNNARTLSGKLGAASNEIESMQEAYRALEAQIQRLKHDQEERAKNLTLERSNVQNQLQSLQTELAKERERRVFAEREKERAETEMESTSLKLDSKNKKMEVEIEVLKSDKSLLLAERASWKSREKELVDALQNGLKANEADHMKSIQDVKDSKDREYANKVKRYEDKQRQLESEVERLEQDISNLKIRHQTEKNNLIDEKNHIEIKAKQLESFKIKELESQLKHLDTVKESLQLENESFSKRTSQLKKEHDKEIESLHRERDNLLHRISVLSSEVNSIKASEQELQNIRLNCSKLQEELFKERNEIERLATTISQKNANIHKLKEEIRKRDAELDARDEENALRVQ